MGFARAIAACVVLGTTLSACNPANDYHYFREGIGTGLYWDGLPSSSQFQDSYFAHICHEAGLPLVQEGDVLTCTYAGMTTRDWGLFVQAGYNDIDLRCDAYLAWLDDRKRSTAPVLKELSAISTATQAILQASNAGPKAITVVGIAFGLAADTFLNVQSRLLQDIDHTTVQSVVLGNQHEFRSSNINVVVDNKPAAIYLLRNYLRICMPFSIEMSINNTVTVFQRVGPEGLRTQQLITRTAVATSDTSAGVRGAPLTARTGLAPTTAPRNPAAGAHGPIETVFGSEDLVNIQSMLCLSSTGALDQATRNGIRIFKETLRQPNPTDITKNDVKLLVEDTARLGKCPAPYLNYYERTTLPGTESISTLQGDLNAVANSGDPVTVNGTLDNATRLKISRVRAAVGVQERNAALNSQITRTFRLKIRRSG